MIKNITRIIKKIFEPIYIRGINRSQFNSRWDPYVYLKDNASKHTASALKKEHNDQIHAMLHAWGADDKMTLDDLIVSAIEYGRKTVLEDFDIVARCDGFVGFTSEEWAGIQRFFKLNKELSKWDQ